MKNVEFRIGFVFVAAFVGLARFKTKAVITRHIGQKQRDKIPNYVATAVETVKTRVVFVGSDDRKTRGKLPRAEVAVVVGEALHIFARTHGQRLQIAQCGIGFDGFQVVEFVAVAHHVGRGQKCFGIKSKVWRAFSLNIFFDCPQSIIKLPYLRGYARGLHLHVGHVAAHEIEIKLLLTLVVFAANIVPSSVVWTLKIQFPLLIIVFGMKKAVAGQWPKHPRHSLRMVEIVLIPARTALVGSKNIGVDVQTTVGRGHGHRQGFKSAINQPLNQQKATF